MPPMSRPMQRRYAWAPIQRRLDQLKLQHRGHTHGPSSTVRPSSIRELANVVSVSRRTLCRYVTEGVPASHTDEIALAVGLLDTEVWPEILDHVVAEEDAKRRSRAAARKRKQYRRRRAEILERNRRYRQEAATAISKQRRRRYERHSEAERARARAYYEANREAILERNRQRRAEERAA